MSLINRMLQDLDARAGQPGAAPLPSDVRPVPAPARGWPLNRVAIAAGVAAVVTAAGFAGWRFFKPKANPAPVAVAVPAAAPALKPAAPAAAVPVVAFEVPVPPRQDTTTGRFGGGGRLGILAGGKRQRLGKPQQQCQGQ